MPFIKQDRRDIIEKSGLAGLDEIQVGDRCYVYYKAMVDAWKANSRWTTAHAIYYEMKGKVDFMKATPHSYDDIAAYELAWQVFFMKYVWPYEQKKAKENGDI